MYKSNNLDFPVHEYPQFNLNDKDESECKADFRFEKNDLNAVAEALQIPDIFKCKQGTVCDGMNGLCIVLKRLAYPTRYSDMIPTFGMSVPELCMILKCMAIMWLSMEWSSSQNLQVYTQNLQVYAESIFRKGAALENCFGFVDGTVRPICRPDEKQRIVYNGHQRVHSLKFQSVVIPNGIVANLYGPIGKSDII